jgi:hypothetical protein
VEIEVRGPAIALPLYEGRVIGHFDFSEKGWVSAKGRGAKWRDIPWERKQVEPQYVMGRSVSVASAKSWSGSKITYMRISSPTNSRTMIVTYLSGHPGGDSVFFFLPNRQPLFTTLAMSSTFSSLTYDYGVRARLGGLNMSEFVVVETAVPPSRAIRDVKDHRTRVWAALLLGARVFAPQLVLLSAARNSHYSLSSAALTRSERLRLRVAFEPVLAAVDKVEPAELGWILRECDHSSQELRLKGLTSRLNAKGFWRMGRRRRVEKGRGKEKKSWEWDFPEQRFTVLSLVAFHDLHEKIAACSGNVAAGIEAFCNQNDGQGWILPEALRLADYGLGHDDRPRQSQPVRSCFGPRFYDWRLAQTAEESWRECHLHARNPLGEEGYEALFRKIDEGEEADGEAEDTACRALAHGEGAAGGATPADGSGAGSPAPAGAGPTQSGTPAGHLFDIEDRPLFQKHRPT